MFKNDSETMNNKDQNNKKNSLGCVLYERIRQCNISDSMIYLFVFFLFFLLQVVVSYDIIKNYFPTQDFLSFIVNSTNYLGAPDIASWFTEGFSKYFIFSPEWSDNFSNYIRPIPNFVYFCEYLLWGENWSGYLLYSCLVNACGILLVFVLSKKYFKLSLSISLLAAFIMFLTGFRLYLYYCPAYVMDAMAAVFLGIAFLFIVRKRYIWSAIFLTCSVFSKEFGMFAPFAAIITYLTIEYREKKRISKNVIIPVLVLLMPAALWFGVRKIFGGGLTGNYGFSYMAIPFSFNLGEWKYFFVKIIRTMFHWPIGWPVNEMRFGAGYEISDIVTGRIFLDFKYIYITAILNPIFGIWFLYNIIQGLRKKKSTHYPEPAINLLPWILGIYALLMLTLDFLGIRYGYSFFMLIIPFSVYMFIKSKTRLGKALFLSYLVVLSFMGLISLKDHYFNRDTQVKFYQNARQLSELIQEAYTEDPTRPIYLINDVSGIWGNYYLGIFAAKDRDVNFTVLNSVWILEDFLLEKPQGDHHVDITQSDNLYTCSIKIPDNRLFFFYGANSGRILKDAIETDEGLICRRSEKVEYVLNLTGKKGEASAYGHRMTINVKDKDPVFIYYSFDSNSYQMVEKIQ